MNIPQFTAEAALQPRINSYCSGLSRVIRDNVAPASMNHVRCHYDVWYFMDEDGGISGYYVRHCV
jgi:hypothetical protein